MFGVMAKSAHRLNGGVKWVGIAVVVGIALVGMWQQTSANTAELRERLTAVETAVPLIQEDVKVILADVKTILTRLPK